MIGWVVRNGTHTGNNFTQLIDSLQSAAKRRGAVLYEVLSNKALPYIKDGQACIGYQGAPLPDFVIFWDKDMHLARHLELMGIRVFNSSRVLEICDDKITTFTELANAGIPMPDTLYAPKLFDVPYADPHAMLSADSVEELLGYPVVVKEAFGSFGDQVYLARNRQELDELMLKLKYQPHLFQRYIDTSFGRDYRIEVVGGRAVASMLRYNDTDFRANITAGGSFKAFTPSAEAVALAEKVAKILGCDFAGIDMMFGKDGEPILCEVNSNAFFVKLGSVSGVDVGQCIMDHVLSCLEKQN